MATETRKPFQMPFFVRQAGLSSYNHEERGAIKGYETQQAANEDCQDRNARARQMNLAAEYEVIAN